MTGSPTEVVFVSQRYPPDKGGNAARVRDLAANLADEETRVTVLAPPPSYPPGEFDRRWRPHASERREGVTVHRLWTWQPQTEDPGVARRGLYYLLFAVHALLWLSVHRDRIGVVVTTSPPITTGLPGVVAAALGVPFVVDVRDMWLDASVALGYLADGGLVERGGRRFQRAVLARADRVAVTTATLGDRLAVRYGGRLRQKTTLVPNGVEPDRFTPDSQTVTDGSGDDATGDSPDDVADDRSGERRDDTSDEGSDDTTDDSRDDTSDGTSDDTTDDSRDGSDAADDPPVIVYTGNLGSAQALAPCLRAVPLLSDDRAIVRLVGSGDRESRLRRLARELEIDHRVEFVGTVPREAVPAHLREATVGLAPLREQPALQYAIPTKLYEYMAAELPALVTGRGEIERFVADSGGGVHARTEPAAIADRLDELLDDPALRRRLGRRGRAYVTANCDRRVVVDDLRRELHALAGDG